MNPQINISNYEAFVVDYLDGTLAHDLHAEFEAFLLAYPQIALEVEEMMAMDFTLSQGAPAVDKQSLKIQVETVDGIDAENYESQFALSLDSDLDQTLGRRVQHFVDVNPVLAPELKLYERVRLEPFHEIGYGVKSGLKQPIPLWSSMNTVSMRVAAAVLLLLGLSTVYRLFDEEIYVPRDGFKEYVEMSSPNPTLLPTTTAIAQMDMEVAATPPTASRHLQREKLETIAVATKLASDWTQPELIERPQPSLAFSLPEVQEVEPIAYAAANTPELSIAQYLGKEFLGVEPNKAQSTKEVLKEGAKNVIAKNEQIAMNTSDGKDDRKTFSLMAAGIEFKRVTYKSN